ncbi:MAG: fused MFS/spermidine synthase [Deltaproteobacteria bacterium]|nr:fused MFS/spermidine synthase [Deltaproteobacteria bacterium]
MSTDLLIFSILIIAIAFFSVMLFAFRLKGEELIYEKISKYHHIMVYEEGSIRTLRLGSGHDDGKQSRIDLNDPDYLLLEYTRLIFAALFVNDKPFKVLIIGLGGGALPRAISRYIPDAQIDVVDIDPDVVEVAERFFMFTPGKLIKIHIGDGRSFIQNRAHDTSGKRYDMVILDAFNSNSIPVHLITKEFLKEVIQVLDTKGVVAANVLIDNRLFHSMLKTYRRVFKRCYLFMGGIAQNAVFISPAPDAPDIVKKGIEERAHALQELYHFSFSMLSVARQFRPRYAPKISAKILTDIKDS